MEPSLARIRSHAALIGQKLAFHLFFALSNNSGGTNNISLVDHNHRNSIIVKQTLLNVLDSEPYNFPEFLHLIEGLPKHVQEDVIVHPYCIKLFTLRSSKRFPTLMMILDIYFLILFIWNFRTVANECVSIMTFHNNAYENNNQSTTSTTTTDNLQTPLIYTLCFLTMYFFIREAIQIIGSCALHAFQRW